MNRVFTVYSSEKKIGKTMLGINLGVSLINETQKSVVLIDLRSGGEGIPASSMLKLPSLTPLPAQELTTTYVNEHVRTHSSKLALLAVDASVISEIPSAEEFIKSLISLALEIFDYVIIDLPASHHSLSYGVIDETDVFILMASSFEYEPPISIIGHNNFRLVVNMSNSSEKSSAQSPSRQYLLPTDTMTVDTFRRSGIPFVIQLPHRRISQTISRLARDLGEKQFGIALTGGAALGLTQIGILEVLERNQIKIDMMTGVSFGALIGTAHAAGVELRRIKQQVSEWARTCRIVSRWSWRRFITKQFFQDSGLLDLCNSLLNNVYFDDLSIPMNVVAIDTRTGGNVIFKEGKVLDAIQSSMRIPGLFVPFIDTESYLIDCSVVHPMPVHPLKQMGANITTAVAVTPTPTENQGYFRQKIKGRLTQEQHTVRQNYTLVTATFDGLMERLSDAPSDGSEQTERITPDVFILPEITGISWRDFHRVNELIDCGIQAAEAMISNIEKLKWG